MGEQRGPPDPSCRATDATSIPRPLKLTIPLAAMRSLSPIYSALPGPAGVDAKQAWVISGWGVLDPLLRYNLAKKRKRPATRNSCLCTTGSG